MSVVPVAVHENVVPDVKLLNEIAVVAPEQIVAVEGVAVANGTGFTVMITGSGAPGQPFAVGITVYVTVPGDAPVANSVCAMLVPLDAVPPLAADCVGAAQLNTVPETVPVKAILVVLPEQIVCAVGVAVTLGVGFTFTVTVTGDPAQVAAVGVME